MARPSDVSTKRVTLDDVALRAGVSKWIASRSITPGASVAEHKRLRVLEVAPQLGCQPSLLARALSKKRSTLAVLLLLGRESRDPRVLGISCDNGAAGRMLCFVKMTFLLFDFDQVLSEGFAA